MNMLYVNFVDTEEFQAVELVVLGLFIDLNKSLC